MSDVPPGKSIDTEMEIPKEGGIPGLTVCYSIVVVFVGFAIFNLSHPYSTPLVGLIASGMWLVIVSAVSVSRCIDEGGPYQFLVNRLGRFAAKQFVQIAPPDGKDTSVVCFGYRIRGRRFYYLKIPIDGIISVYWNTGQASSMAGRDMNDWSVALWYDTIRVKTKSGASPPRKPQAVYIVGPSGPKEGIETFGLSFVGFLGNAGAMFSQTEDRREFLIISALPLS